MNGQQLLMAFTINLEVCFSNRFELKLRHFTIFAPLADSKFRAYKHMAAALQLDHYSGNGRGISLLSQLLG